MWKIGGIKVLPYEKMEVGRFPDSIDITFAFQRFFADHDLCDPTKKVVIRFMSGAGSSDVGIGAFRDFIVDGDDVYLRLSYKDVGIHGKQSGLKKIKDKKLIWSLRRVNLSNEALTEMKTQIAKEL